MKRLILLISTLAILITTITITSTASGEPSFDFTLQTDGKSEKQVTVGDIVTVAFTLERTDSTSPYKMYAMQNEIRYDSTFFELVEESFFVKDGITVKDIAVSDTEREIYMNYLSMSGGSDWKAKTTIGSFQLRVIGTSGASLISNQDCGVSRMGGSGNYAHTVSDIVIIVSDDCTVTFDSNGGSDVPSQSVKRLEMAAEPSEPTRSGLLFTGWYKDEKCTEKWDFSNQVKHNLTLYAGWSNTELPKESTSSKLPFTDVSESDWFYESVEYVYNNGLMSGTTNTTFAPQSPTSRAMLVTILWRMEGSPTVNHTINFTDVQANQWYTDAIRWAAANGIVSGYNDTVFGTNDAITREQMAVFMWRYAKYKGFDANVTTDRISSYADAAQISSYAIDALNWACSIGLINGMGDNMLSPQGTTTRAQAATILMRFCQ